MGLSLIKIGFFYKVLVVLGKSVFRLQCFLHGIHCVIGKDSLIWRCRVVSKKGGGCLIIGSGCFIRCASFQFYGEGGQIVLKDRITINAHPKTINHLSVKGHSCITIESDCLFSNSVDISTTDWHNIYSVEGTVLNPEKNVFISRHVWIGKGVTICKGVSIPDGCVIGTGSVVTKSFGDKNVIIAGNPATVKKDRIRWEK